MGHIRLGRLPRTRKWQEVIDLIATRANTAEIAAATLDALLAGKPGYFSWRELVSGKAPEQSELRRFIEIHPVLDYGALEPGKVASDAIRQTAADLKLN